MIASSPIDRFAMVIHSIPWPTILFFMSNPMRNHEIVMLSLYFCLVFSVFLPVSRGKQLSAAPDSSCQFSVHREGPDGPIVVGIHLPTDYQNGNYMFRFFLGRWALLQNSLFIPACILLVRFKLHCQWFISQIDPVDSNHRCEWLQSRHFPLLPCSGIIFA